MKYQLGINNPRVGLVNIGLESNKGNELTKKAFGSDIQKLIENPVRMNESIFLWTR